MNKNGFTLIELVVVIVILGILSVTAAPRFLNFSKDAHIAAVSGTGAAFRSAIGLAYAKALVSNGGGPIDDLQMYGSGASGQIDINLWGYPAQQYNTEAESSPRLNNVDDCLSVWRALYANAPSISESSSKNDSLYQAIYNDPDQCTYKYNPLPTLNIDYDSRNGSVVIDRDTSS
ncbi:prepilin-type N-terminal cleavage/methylation domain-containing protein [Parasalinivibrio latis]|uniref:type II secretion system protein n=1 Tax=Parasalinivibrio latis TaxID=2952610 RepID=UPI0030DE6B0B